MTRVLRPLKGGEGGHAPLCEMVESTQAQVYEALAYYLDDLMIPENITKFATGAISGRYLVKLDDGRTVATNPFRVEHPSESKECLDNYMAMHPTEFVGPNLKQRDHNVWRAAAGFMITGLVHIGLSRHALTDNEAAFYNRQALKSAKSSVSGAASSWFRLLE